MNLVLGVSYKIVDAASGHLTRVSVMPAFVVKTAHYEMPSLFLHSFFRYFLQKA